MRTFRSSFNLKVDIDELAESLPQEGSLTKDHYSNALVYLAMAYKELLKESDDLWVDNTIKTIRKEFFRLLYRRAVRGKNIDDTYLTRFGRLKKHEDADSR